MNPAFEAVSGYTQEEVVGRSAEFLSDGGANGDDAREIWRTVRAGGVWEGQFISRAKDGNTYEEDGTVSPVRNENGKIVRFVAVKRDVSGVLQLERQLAQSRKMEALGTLAGGVAHDFNNILLAIFGYCELSQEDVPEGSAVHRNLGVIMRAAERAKNLVSQILTFSRDEGKEIWRPTPMFGVVQESLILLRATLPSSIAIQKHLDEDVGEVHANANQIQQVMLNLGANASHAMGEDGGILTIRLGRVDVDPEFASTIDGLSEGPYVHLVVEDSGCGMDEVTVACAFDPFFTTKGVGKGTGLGLSVVHGIVMGHGGAISVDSELGKWTRFSMYFPRVIGAQAGANVGQLATHELRGSERILVVDDEPDLALLVRRGLGKLGYRVTALGESTEALTMLREHPHGFDTVVTGQTMPHCTGHQLVEQLRRLRSDIPVILTTGYHEAVTPQHTEGVGIEAVLMKPYSIERLARALRSLLDAAQ